MNRFIFRMAWRETRGAWRHFLYFFACIAIGVGALVGVSLFSTHVERAVTKEARGMLGGDLEIRLTHALSLAGQAVLQGLGDRNLATTHVSELVAMAARTTQGPASTPTQIIELKAVESAYPLYGALRLEPAQSLNVLLHPDERRCGGRVCFGAVVQESLLIRMGLSVGDRVKIGQAMFLITGIVRTEPDRMANAFTLGPRVMIAQEGLRAAELIKPGSRIRERYLVKIPPDMPLDPLLTELRDRLAADSVRISSYRTAQSQLRQFLDQLSRYLGLIGLTALFIGGLGVGTSIHAFLRDKLRTIAILKSVGADSATVVFTYVVQAIFLGCVGSLAGILLGIALQRGLPPLIAAMFGSDLLDQLGVSSELSWPSIWPLLKGAALGLLSTLLFTLWPLLKIREVQPGAIFRRDAEQLTSEPGISSSRWWVRWGLADRWNVGTAGGIILGLCALSVWQAGSWSIGFLFLGALSLAIAILFMCARVFVLGLASVPMPRVLSLRYALGNVVRPGSQATGIMVAIGIGVMVIVTVSLVEQALLHQIQENRPADAPTFFFIDIQADQAEGFVSLVDRQTGRARPELTPLVRSRLHAINGQVITIEEGMEKDDKRTEGKEGRGKQWYFTREYVLTFLDKLPKDNQVIKGEWWKPGQIFSTPQVSVEEDAAKHLGLAIGSTVEFDIQGAMVSAEVSSIRKVEWGNFSTNFFMILSPGAIEGAPFTYVATVRVPPEKEVPLQQAVVASFPNISAIHIGDVLDGFAQVLDRLALAIRAVALFCVVAGALVMAAALASTRYRRLYESVILKALGATRGLIARAFAMEYVLLGAVAGLIGLSLGSVLSWALVRFVFELPWSMHPQMLGIGLFLTMVLTLIVGFSSTYRILGQRPLAVLRHE